MAATFAAIPANAAGPVLPEQARRQWAEGGAVLVSGVFPEELIRKLRGDIRRISGERKTKFGRESALTFPSESAALNEVTVHPRILVISTQLLETKEIRLSQAEGWAKTGVTKEAFAKRDPREAHDQRVHCDYPNHTLAHPSAWESPDAVSFILYLSDYDDCAGGTAVVPRRGASDPAYAPTALTRTPGVLGAWINDREMAEARYAEGEEEVYRFRQQLYAREVYCKFKPGDLLVYRQDTWHRGTRVKAGVTRFVMNLTYRRQWAEWIGHWHPGWARKNYHIGWPHRRGLEATIARLEPFQRSVLGFPAPGHPYWNEYTLAAVAARYKGLGMDMAPYVDGYNKREQPAAAGSSGGAARVLAQQKQKQRQQQQQQQGSSSASPSSSSTNSSSSSSSTFPRARRVVRTLAEWDKWFAFAFAMLSLLYQVLQRSEQPACPP